MKTLSIQRGGLCRFSVRKTVTFVKECINFTELREESAQVLQFAESLITRSEKLTRKFKFHMINCLFS